MLQFIFFYAIIFTFMVLGQCAVIQRKEKKLRQLSETQTSGSFYEIGLASSPLCAVAHL